MTAFPPLTHLAVTVRDLGVSVPWYEKLFDAKPVLDEDTDPDMHHTVYLLGNGTLFGLHQHKTAAPPESFSEHRIGLDHVAFGCADRGELEQWAKRLDDLKDIRPDEILDGIRRAASGEYLINESVLTRPLVASRVLKQFRDLSMVGQEMEPLFVPLSAREIEVLDYIARGNSNKEIARALKISDQTVKNHITSILRKLAVNDRTQAVVYALRRGWIKMQEL